MLGITDISRLGVNLPNLVAQLVNFALLLVILWAVAYRPLLRLFDERSRRIREGLEAADRMKQEAAAREQAMQAELEGARREGQQIIAQAQQIGNRLQEEARERARAEGEALVARARTEIEMERDAAIGELRRQFAELTISAAEKVIGQSLDRRAHQRLIDEVLTTSTFGGNGSH